MSFILQFVRSGPTGAARWRGQLQEVESGDRSTLASLAALGGALAAHGVTLPPDLDADAQCPVCGARLGGSA